MAKLRETPDRVLGRSGPTVPVRAEEDVAADPARVDSREPGGGYVGRVAADDDFSGETGAERRASG